MSTPVCDHPLEWTDLSALALDGTAKGECRLCGATVYQRLVVMDQERENSVSEILMIFHGRKEMAYATFDYDSPVEIIGEDDPED